MTNGHLVFTQIISTKAFWLSTTITRGFWSFYQEDTFVELYQSALSVLWQDRSSFGVCWARRILLLVMTLGWVGGAWRSREVVGKKVVLRKAISRHDLSPRLQLSNMFHDTPRRRRKITILGGKMGLFVFLSACMKYVNIQML